MDRRCVVTITKFAEKQLRRLPKFIKEHFLVWTDEVEKSGIRIVRTYPGYHDEPLIGNRLGQRSVRLSRSYRVIYEETEQGEVTVVAVLEITHHEY